MRTVVIDLAIPERGWFRFYCVVSPSGRVAIQDPAIELTPDETDLIGKAALEAAKRLGLVKGN